MKPTPLFNSTNPIIELDLSPIAHSLKAEMSQLRIDPYEQPEKAAKEGMSILLAHLIFKDYMKIIDFATMGSHCALRITGLPVTFTTLPPTPAVDTETNGKDFLSEILMLAISGVMRMRPVLNQEEKGSKILQQVVPLKGMENTQSGGGSAIEFSFHVENVHMEDGLIPNFFILSCLRGHPSATTNLLPIDAIVLDLPFNLVVSLKKNIYRHFTGVTYVEKRSIDRPVLVEIDGELYVRLNMDPARTVGITEEGTAALTFLRNTFTESHVQKVCLQQGDMLVVNNLRCLHGRSAFSLEGIAQADMRWLQRLYLTSAHS